MTHSIMHINVQLTLSFATVSRLSFSSCLLVCSVWSIWKSSLNHDNYTHTHTHTTWFRLITELVSIGTLSGKVILRATDNWTI